MDVYEAVHCRRSVRSFKPDAIPQAVLDRVLDAARCAPSSMNLQPWKFILVAKPETKRELISHCPGQSFAEEAPLLVVACGLPTEGTIAGKISSSVADVAVALAYLSLTAADEGLGTCWISAFSEAPVKAALQVPEYAQVVAITPLGYPTDTTLRAKYRKPLEEVVSREKFG